MPLVKKPTKTAFRRNVETLMKEVKAGTSEHVKTPQQALAVSYSIKRRSQRKSEKKKYG
jgi:hypothetical protein